MEITLDKIYEILISRINFIDAKLNVLLMIAEHTVSNIENIELEDAKEKIWKLIKEQNEENGKEPMDELKDEKNNREK